MAVDPAYQRRLGKLLVVREKFDVIDDAIGRVIQASIQLEARLTGASEKESADFVIQMFSDKERGIHLLNGLVVLLLTEKDQFTRYFQLMLHCGDNLWTSLTCVNMILLETYHRMQETAKDQLVCFFREAVKLRIPKVENVVYMQVRVLNSSVEWNSKIRISLAVAQLLMDNEQWMLSMKSTFLFAQCLVTFGNMIADIQSGYADNVRNMLIHLCTFILRSRKADSSILGRDLILILMRLSRVPAFQQYWKELISNPASLGYASIDELYHGPLISLMPARLALDVTKKLDFLLQQCKPSMEDKHFEWLLAKHLSGNDAVSVRSEMIRYVLWYGTHGQMMNQHINEAKIHLLYVLFSSAQPGLDLQWNKTVIWSDWLFYDTSTPYIVLEPVIGLVRLLMNTTSTKGISLLEYICKSVFLIDPSRTDQVRSRVNAAMKVVADGYAQSGQHINSILEHPRIEKTVRDLLSDVFKDFVKPSLPQAPTSANDSQKASTSNEGQPSVDSRGRIGSVSSQTTPVSSSENGRKRIARERQQGVEEPNKSKRKNNVDSSSLSLGPARVKTKPKEEIEKEIETSFQLLRDELKPVVQELRDAFQSAESDDGDKGEAVQQLLVKVLDTDDSIEEEQIEIMSACLQLLIGSPLNGDRRLLASETPTDESLNETFAHPLFIIFRNLCFSSVNDNSARDTMVTVIAAMRDHDLAITYLLLFFMKAGVNANPVDCAGYYGEIAKVCDKEVYDMLADDLQEAALDDHALFAQLVPFVFEKFANVTGNAAKLFEIVCSNLDATQLSDLVGAVVRESITIFRRDTFVPLVTASLEWDTTAQWAFWQLVHAEGIQFDWACPLITKVQVSENPEAATNIILMIRRMDREPNMLLLRAILSRKPSLDDTLAVNLLKVLVEDPEVCTRVSELIATIVNKAVSSGEIRMNSPETKPTQRKPLAKLSLEQVCTHLFHFSSLCLMKEKKAAEKLLASSNLRDAVENAKNNDKASALFNSKKGDLMQLFEVMNVLTDDSPTQRRTLRGGSKRTEHTSSQNNSNADQESKKNKGRKGQRVYISASSSDSEEESKEIVLSSDSDEQ